ncbi:MAG TPA: adenosine deaminase [Bryobacteraceae bacterium]|nr:adenosine deaminase [Bryobacteraceae bacterium]
MRPTYREMPKAELHLHLEGSLEPETLAELDPHLDLAAARARYQYADFQGFIQGYIWAVGHLKAPEHFALAARRLLERLHAQNVCYTEITLSAGVMFKRGQNAAEIFAAVQEEAAHSPVEVRWILDAVRQWGAEPAREVLRLAIERIDVGIIGFGIGGDEAAGPVEWFGELMEEAREAGLRLTIHAGEGAGAESVRNAVRLGAERIGHGIRAVNDAALLAELAGRRIPLEICISSNVATRIVPSLERHPVRRIYDAGVPIVLATDDPAMFHTTLEREYELARERFGFTDEELCGIVENGFRYAFSAGAANEARHRLPREPVG